MITAVVLAAGAGERLGGTKALARIPGDDATFLERVVRTCVDAGLEDVLVVTGWEAERVEEAARALGHPVRCARNERWREGRTGSVQAGVRACDASASMLVFPVDHPLVRVVTLDAMLGVFGYSAEGPDVLVPTMEIEGTRRRGHPILLHARLRDGALALGLDQPLRDLVHASVALEVPVDDEGILLDVDTPEDLARAEGILSSRA